MLENLNFKQFYQNIKYQFNNEDLIKEALTHPSLSRNKGVVNYQRLEFLGDKVISFVIAEFLIKKYPQENEGNLSKRHAHLVSGEHLAKIADNIGLAEMLKLSKGEEKIGGKNNKNNLEDAVEAVIGGIYLDSDFESTKNVILYFWNSSLIEERDPPQDPISQLQEMVQAKSKTLPIYRLEKCGGSDHLPIFNATLTIDNPKLTVNAKGNSKKLAQRNAAIIAIEKIFNI